MSEKTVLTSTHNTCCRLTIKSALQSIGSFVVPVLLAIFTVIITFQQRSEASQQRLQDLNISREQRDQDKRNADDKRIADDINAEKQRNMSRDQREHELEVEQHRYDRQREQYLDNLLLSYYNEIGQSLKESKGTLSSSPIISAIVRAKTLNVIEQIGPLKAVHLIKFLFDANQLSQGSNSLDLTNAQLNNIDLSGLPPLPNIYIIGAHLNNALFVGQDLSRAHFIKVQLRGANFSRANIAHAVFRDVDLTGSTFKDTHAINTDFHSCKMEHIDFTNTNFKTNDVTIRAGEFLDSSLSMSSFRRAFLFSVRFVFCNMTFVDFSNANLQNADFTGSLLVSSLFRNTKLEKTTFLSANLSFADFQNSSCLSPIFLCGIYTALSLDNAILPSGNIAEPSKPLINYGYPQCNSIVNQSIDLLPIHKWSEKPTNSVVLHYRLLTNPDLYRNGCVFTIRNNISTQVNLTQTIDLEKYLGIIREERAKATIRCRVGYNTHVRLTQMTSKYNELHRSEAIGLRWQEILHPRTEVVRISIEFHNPRNKASAWCLYVELYIESVIKAPGYQLWYPWDSTDL